jgi:2-C-methyl-D-erythritol 4-phosphate cytidylyltransferase
MTIKNTALIFAGGVGKRMQSTNRPKQFLELGGKPIIIHTIEHFEEHPDIDAIVVVCIESWIDFLKEQLAKFNIHKVIAVVPGGASGQESIRNGLYAIRDNIGMDAQNVTVLIHDGVRPLINEKVITDNIESVKKYGNAITVVPAIETIIETDADGELTKVEDRNRCRMARAPQSFVLADILEAHRRLIEDGEEEMIDSAMLMQHYGAKLHTVIGPTENIKITTPTDYYLFRALVEAKENQQFGGEL